jgi:IclR family acetate operon transcriptional repressor
MMQTVDKAFRLLDLFSIEAPEHGLSEIARLAKYDKATTLRLLTALERNGFVEQHPATKKYRLGKSLLRFSRIREVSFPVSQVVLPILDRVAEATEETAHASLSSGATLVSIGIAAPRRAMHVHISPSELIPFHATATGIAVLAYSDEKFVDEIIARKSLKRFTEHTVVSADALRRQLTETRKRGFALSARGFDADVISIAAPIFDGSGGACGALAVACVAARMNAEKRRQVTAQVLRAAIEATRGMGAEPHPSLLNGSKELAA